MRVVVTGASGLIGRALVAALEERGDSVTRVSRRAGAGVVQWDPAAGTIDAHALEAHDGVVHLAGESIGGLWTAAKKRRIRESRVLGTRLLASALAGLTRKPNVLVTASAIGFYGDRSELVDEASARGAGFLAEVVAEWEAETETAARAGIRVANARFGVVLSGRGGALRILALPVRLGMGGRQGTGRQAVSWVALEDVVRALLFILDGDISGPVNVVAPGVVTNAELVQALGRVLHRPVWLHVPAFVLRALLGPMAEEMILAGARVTPGRLQENGFRFQYPEVQEVLRHALLARAS